jgi:magnesium-transporting ATPase (P-type)
MMRLTAYARDVSGDVIVVDADAGVPADTRAVNAAALAVDG